MRQFYTFTKIFDAAITPKSKLVYIYLCRMANRNSACFPSRKTIAAACGLCVQSVKRAVKEFADYGLITKTEQHKENGRQTSNLYTIVRKNGDHYFYLDNDIFTHDISTNAKLVFTYIQRNMTDGKCFPSYNQIAAACGICATTALSCVRELIQAGLIDKAAQYRENGGRSNNLYGKPQPEQAAAPERGNAKRVRPPATIPAIRATAAAASGYFLRDMSTPPHTIYVPP